MNKPHSLTNLLRFLRLTTLALALAPFVSPVSAVEFVSNGSFETGKDFAGAAYTSVNPGTADLPGWTGPAGFPWYINGPVWGTPAQDGTRFMNLVYTTGTYPLSQSFAVTAGRVYTVSYYERYRGGGAYMDTTLSVAAGTVTGAGGTPVTVSSGPAANIVQTTATGNAAWTLHSFTFTPSTTTTATITFGNHYTTSPAAGDNDGVYVDNVSVAAPAIPSATNSTVVAIPITVANDGVSTATITVTLRDSSTNLAAGKTVTLASSRGATDTISAASGPSNTNGVVTFTVKSTTAGVAVFTATDTTDGTVIVQTATVTFAVGAPDPTHSTVTASPTSVTANGAASSTITVTLLTRSNAPTSGKTVTLASSRGTTDTISAASGPSSVSGVVTFTVKSTTAGSAIFTATDTTDVMVVAQAATVTFTPTSVSATNSPVTASPASVAGDGVAASTISVTLRDAYNNPVSGKTVTLASSRPTTDTISAASGASTTNGLVTFTVTSVTNGSSVFTATDVTDSNLVLTPTATVVFTNSSAKAILSCSFGALGAATISGTNISIHVPASQPVTNLAPTFTVSPAATLSPASGSTNNFASPVSYTVTAQNGSTQRYLVSVLSYAAWSNSASLYILTKANGANLPAGALETNFPVLVRLNNNNFNFSQAKTNGADIRFESASGGVVLSYQIEQWDTNAGNASVWVCIPVIQGNTNQQIRMYWGKADAASESSGPAVFNATNGYVCVMHLSDPVSPLKDELGNVTPVNVGSTASAGVIGQGRSFVSPNPGIICGQNITTFPTGDCQQTVSAWLKPEAGGTGDRVLVIWGMTQFWLNHTPPHFFSGGHIEVFNSQWCYYVQTYQPGYGQQSYVNAAPDYYTSAPISIPGQVPFMVLGGETPSSWQYVGGMDEVRVSKVARSANWIKLEYANQKPLQTLMGSLVQPGTNFSVAPASVTINEGATTNIVAQAGGAIKLYWVYKSGTQETVIAVDQPTLNFAAGRVVGDQSFTLSFRALYLSGVVVTNDIPVTIKEAILDPVYTLTGPAAWDGRQTMTVTPNISNWAAMVAAGATNLTYTWSVSGVAVIPQVAPSLTNPGIWTTPTLTLLRSQGSGPLTVTLVLDNGGVLVTNSVTVPVQQPATDAWAVRTPGATETPMNNQFYARDDTGYGTLYYNGTIGGSPSSVFIKVYTNGGSGDILYTNISKAGGGAYAFTARIPAGLIKYRVEFYSVTGGTTNLLNTATNIVCGDAYLIDGQSNAVAYNYGGFTNLTDYTYTSTWIRSYGTQGEGGQGSELIGGWGDATQTNSTGIGFVGYWGMYIAKQLVDNYKMPICLLQGAVGGTLIYQHMPNPTSHADPATIYGRLLERVQAANLTHGIRGVMWHQGESDSGSGAPTGDWDYKSYRQYFVDLTAAWKTDYPNIRYYYTFQVWPQPCSMNPYGDQIREIQRTLPYMYSNLRVMSTIGTLPPVWCHTTIDGYVQFGRLLGALVQKDNYGYVPTTPITAPDIKQAWFTTTNRTEIALEFDQNMMWDNAFTNFMFLDGAGGKVTLGTVSGNVISLQLSGASTNQTITYVKDQVNLNLPVLGTPVMRGSNGIAALTFADVPIAISGSLSAGINTLPATGLTTNSAVLNGTLGCPGTNYAVYAYWNTVSGGTNAALWTNSAYVGAWTNVAPTNISYPVTGLALNTTYYFTFRATNAVSDLWAANVLSFTTLAPPSPPGVDNAVGAANLSPGVAQLRGMLTNGPADVRLYWGPTDGGTTPANWAKTSLLAGQGSGSFAGNVSNLLYGLTYYYRAFASNQYGTAWAPATEAFTTLKLAASAAVQIPYSSLVEVAASSAYNGYPATNAFNGAGLAGDGTHNTSAGGSWFSTSVQPVVNQWLKVRFDQTYALDHLRVWAFNQSVSAGVTNADVYVLDNATDPAGNVNLGGGPFKTNGWSLWLAQQPFKPSSGGTETNTDPNLSLGGVSARQLALKVNNVVSGNFAGFAEIQIYQLPSVLSLANSAATGVAATTAALNATLACTGSVYRVDAFWNTVNGGTDPPLWTNSANVGSWTNVSSTNLSFSATGLAPSMPYYFTFRATNAVDTLWAANVQSFTTLASTTPPMPLLPGSAITFSNGAPTFTFGTVAGYKYRLDYKNALLDATWLPVIAPGFPPPNGWSATSTGGNMSLSDTNTAGQPQRFYRLESANP